MVRGHLGGVRREGRPVRDVEPVGAHLAGALPPNRQVLDQVDRLGQPGLVDVGDREQRTVAGGQELRWHIDYDF